MQYFLSQISIGERIGSRDREHRFFAWSCTVGADNTTTLAVCCGVACASLSFAKYKERCQITLGLDAVRANVASQMPVSIREDAFALCRRAEGLNVGPELRLPCCEYTTQSSLAS